MITHADPMPKCTTYKELVNKLDLSNTADLKTAVNTLLQSHIAHYTNEIKTAKESYHQLLTGEIAEIRRLFSKLRSVYTKYRDQVKTVFEETITKLNAIKTKQLQELDRQKKIYGNFDNKNVKSFYQTIVDDICENAGTAMWIAVAHAVSQMKSIVVNIRMWERELDTFAHSIKQIKKMDIETYVSAAIEAKHLSIYGDVKGRKKLYEIASDVSCHHLIEMAVAFVDNFDLSHKFVMTVKSSIEANPRRAVVTETKACEQSLAMLNLEFDSASTYPEKLLRNCGKEFQLNLDAMLENRADVTMDTFYKAVSNIFNVKLSEIRTKQDAAIDKLALAHYVMAAL